MSLLKETGKYIFKREAYRAYRSAGKNVNAGTIMVFFYAIIIIIIGVIWFNVFKDKLNNDFSIVLILLLTICTFVTLGVVFKKYPAGIPVYGPTYVTVRDRRYSTGVRQDYAGEGIVNIIPFTDEQKDAAKTKLNRLKITWIWIFAGLFIIESLMPNDAPIKPSTNKNIPIDSLKKDSSQNLKQD